MEELTNIETPTYQSSSQKQINKASKGSRSRKWLGVLLAMALIMSGGLTVYLLSNKTNNTKSTSTPVITEEKTNKTTPDSVIYYSKAKETDPYTIYLRPAKGGERQAVLTLSTQTTGNYISSYEVMGQNIAFSSEDGIYVSQNGGKTFKNVYALDPAKASNQAITSLHFSTNGKKVVFAFLPGYFDGKTSNTVKIMDLNGQNVTDLHTFDNVAGIFVYNYDSAKQQLIYAKGCYFCDGGPSVPHLMDMKANSDKQLLEIDSNSQIFNPPTVSPDGQKLLYYVGINDQELTNQVAGPGWQGGPPYKVVQIDLTTGESNQLATIGSLHEKGSDGKFKLYSIRLGFTDDTYRPYYTADNKLFVLDKNKFNLVFEAKKNILYLPYLSKDKLFTSIDSSTAGNSDYTFYLYEIATQKSTSIYEGDGNTTAMGVTTK